jgi:RNA polymerase sigma-70 factor (ECF subfamily)
MQNYRNAHRDLASALKCRTVPAVINDLCRVQLRLQDASRRRFCRKKIEGASQISILLTSALQDRTKGNFFTPGYATIDVELAQLFMANEVTLLLEEIGQNRRGSNREALDRLLPIVYDELRRLAASFLRREYAVSIQTTELVHEAYFKLTNQRKVDWENRGQFFAIAAQAMRRILIDAARMRRSLKHGVEKVPLDDSPTISVEVDQNLIELDEALSELARFDEQQARIVELRYFAGLTIEETADVLKISPATVKREWAIARAWLYQKIKGD